MEEISPEELKKALIHNSDFQLLDVREEEEHVDFNIGGLLIPLDDLISSMKKLNPKKPIVVYCKRGIRSAIAIQRLQAKGFKGQLLNLKGGVTAWKQFFPEDFIKFGTR